MKELSIDRMEMVSGGMDQRNCLITGAVIVLGFLGALVNPPIGIGVASAGVLAGTAGNCF